MDGSQCTKPNCLDAPVTELRGVGPERAALLGRLGILTVRDLLLLRPRRYEDRRNFVKISGLVMGDLALAAGKVVAKGTKWFARHTKSIFEVVLDDGTGRLHCRWWNANYMEKVFEVGDEVVVCGKLSRLKPKTIDHPETEVVDRGPEGAAHVGRIVPIYPLTEGLSQRWLRGLIWRTLQEVGEEVDGALNEGQPVAKAELSPALFGDLSYGNAIRLMHAPDKPGDPERARRRLAFDELFEFQRKLQQRRRNFYVKAQGLPCSGNNRLIRPLLAGLGFKLTNAQTRVLREIRAEMGGAHPMRRLLQGDVGSGKTLVAFCAALMAIESGFAVAMMAPTEILAEQHFRTARKWLQPLGVDIHILTGARKTVAPGDKVERALFIGTHALIEEGFAPPKLGLAIIDEQHKFGVAQREDLLRKGSYPHLLVMTATPIPRTLALTLYGELDSSVIDEMPPGRGSIRTFLRHQGALPKVWEFVKSQLKSGRQAYIIYPRVEETAGNVKAVAVEFEKIRGSLAPYTVAMLHGRVPSAEKDRVMSDFAEGRVQALLSTSLVEVGVDVPNATVMVIENAEQFGLAQLHQLRGRIGRGSAESYCVLVSGARDVLSEERLQILEKSTDGFHIAEADLALRGPGEFLGHEQSGAAGFKFADLAKDLELLRQARSAAVQCVAT